MAVDLTSATGDTMGTGTVGLADIATEFQLPPMYYRFTVYLSGAGKYSWSGTDGADITAAGNPWFVLPGTTEKELAFSPHPRKGKTTSVFVAGDAGGETYKYKLELL